MSLLTGGLDARAERANHSCFKRIAAIATVVALTSTPALGQNFGAFDNGFSAFSDTGAALANPDIAVGPESIVAVSSGEVAWYDRNMVRQGGSPLAGPGGLWEGVSSASDIHDVQAIWNANADRFYVVANTITGPGSAALDFAISKTADPADGWLIHRIPSALFTNLSVGVWGDGLYFTFNMPGNNGCRYFRGTLEQLTGHGQQYFFGGELSNTAMSFSANNTDGVGDPRMIMASHNPISISKIRLNSTGTVIPNSPHTPQWVSIPWQSEPPSITLPNSGSINIDGLDFRSAKVVNDSCWLAQTVSRQDRAIVRWYEIDLNGWPNSGQAPELSQHGDIDMGEGVHAFLPDIAVDADGNAAIVFSVASANQPVSLARVVRFADDPVGEFRQPVIYKQSNDVVNGGVWGAYVGIEADPEQPGVFWSHAPYQEDGGWKTWISKVTLAEEEPPSDGPRLHTPDNGYIAYVIPIIQWTFNDLASGFRVQISDGPSFDEDTYTSQSIQGNSFEIPDGLIDCNKRYYWRVIAETSHGDMMSDPESRWFERRIRHDLNGDGIVDSADLGLLIAAFNSAEPVADFNDDGWVNSADLGSLISAFGRTCD